MSAPANTRHFVGTDEIASSAVTSTELATPFTDLSTLVGSPASVGSSTDLRLATGQGIEDGSGNTRFNLLSGGTTIDDETGTRRINANSSNVQIKDVDLRLATGQAIEDGGGTDRLSFESSQTKLTNENGDNAFMANDGVGHWIQFDSNTGSRLIYDQNGAFDAVTYTTSSSTPGTLELTNAELNLNENDITGAYDIYSNSGGRVLLRAKGSAGENGLYDDFNNNWYIRQYNGGDLQFNPVGAVKTLRGLEVEGSNYHSYAGVKAGPNANSGHLMLDANGGILHLNWHDNGTVQTEGTLQVNAGISGVGLGDLDNVSASGEGSGNNFDADTVDGKHASEIGGVTFASESGGWTEQFSGTRTTTVSFTNTYTASSFMHYASGVYTDSSNVEDAFNVTVKSLSTDSNGNITGMTIQYQAGYTANTRVDWRVSGETV